MLTQSTTRVADLCVCAVRGHIPMLDPASNLFCYRLNQTKDGMVREGLSPRYTAMSLLGLDRFRSETRQALPFDLDGIFDALVADLAWVDNLGDLGLVIWLCAVVRPGALGELYEKLAVDRALVTYGGPGCSATMELAWFLAGLAHASLADGDLLKGLPELSIRTLRLLTANQGKHGTFGHSAKSGTGPLGSLRARIGSFADQVYPIYALAKAGEAFANPLALEDARRCAEAICRAQGPRGQWWWHYDAVTGKIFERYPVYSVHQHGMAPMALYALGDAAGLDFRDAIDLGLGWIDGNNELGRDMRDRASSVVWRSVYRRNRITMYFREFSDYLRSTATPVPAEDLDVMFECRPYELGWLLYAFAGRA